MVARCEKGPHELVAVVTLGCQISCLPLTVQFCMLMLNM